jgi:spore germination protein YaaH
MPRFRNLLLALILAGGLVLQASPNAAPARAVTHADLTHPSIMAAAAQQANSPAGPLQLYGAAGPRADIPLVRPATPLQREVFGFADAFNLGDPLVGYTSWNFGLLSTVAFFGLQVNSGDGNLVTTNKGWAVYHSSTMTNFVNTAHANGTRVIVSLNLHDFSTSPTNQVCQGLIAANTQNTIAAAGQQVAAAGIDGVNVDYEGSDTVCANGLTERQQLVTFMQNLRAAMPQKYIAIDTYSGSAEDNLEFFDVTAIAPYVDSFFVMAYDMDEANYNEAPLNCSTYCFNPISPLNTYRFNVTKSMSQYTALVPASKVILGQPYYGRRGCGYALNQAHTPRVPGTNFAAPTYTFASTVPSQPGVVSYASFRDPGDGVSQWDTWYDTDWQCDRVQYWDDVYSLGAKYDVVNADNLRGVGLFTLDYAGGAPELWNLLAAKFTTTTPWDSLSGTASSSPAVATSSASRMDLFVRGSDYALYHKFWNGTVWSDWESLGGRLTASPAAVSWGANHIDVFVRGTDNGLYTMTWDGTSWSAWKALGGTLASGPGATSWAVGRLDVLARGSNSQLFHKWFTTAGGWSQWESLGGLLSADPAAVSWGPNRLDIFVRGSNLGLFHKFWDGAGWSAWESLGGTLTSGPAAASCASGHLDVFATGTDHGLWQKGWNATSWRAWQPQGGRWVVDPAAACVIGTTTEALFEEGIDSAIWHSVLPAS